MPIEKKDGRWYIHNVKGSHATYSEALSQLKAIKASQKRRKKHG